nr:MAG TPA: replisome organizer [Caudoviricetes sp.]DAY45095.1 MAG TPA: replisome organizer [Caudoviricetes sp.]
MAKADVMEVILLLQSTIPNSKLSEENVRAYVSFLSDINPVTLKQAVINLVKINKIKFYPSVGEILSACEEISNYVNAYEEIPIAQDAWEKVRRCVSTYSFEHGLNHLDGITLQAAKTIWSSFNPRMGDDYNEASCRSQFIRCYEQLAEREQRNNKVANAIKENHVLLQARKKAEKERALLNAGQKKIEMTATGNLVEVAKEPVDVTRIIDNSQISDKGKALLKSAIGG